MTQESADRFKAEDEWRAALDPIFGSTERSLKLLAEMLRSQKPIPPGVRNALALLCDPGHPDLYGLRLKIVETNPPSKVANTKWLPVTVAYRNRIADGEKADDAAEAVANQFNMTARHVYRCIEKWDKFQACIKGD